MASLANNDFFSLAEEQFDFDLPLSPASDKAAEDDEDEVFLGPVGHKEKCISVGIESHLKEGSSSSGLSLGMELGSWSPLMGDKFDQIFKEAHLVACQIEKNDDGERTAKEEEAASKEEEAAATTAGTEDKTVDEFAEDSRAKLSMLGKPSAGALSPIKRETFCVQDSPLKQLPPAIQQRLLKAGGVSRPAQAAVKTCSPVKVRSAQPKATLRGKTALSCGKEVLPSRPTVPRVIQHPAKTRLPPPDRTRLAPPDKGKAGRKCSPSSRHLSSAGSSEDLFSDTASVASDVSDSSFNTSLPNRRGLPAPSKTGLRAPPAMKAPPLQSRRVVERRKNTSSSSSSVSSLNSSLSTSPSAKGKFNTSLSSGASGAKTRGPSSLSRLPGSAVASVKPRASSVTSRAPEPVTAGKPSATAQGKKPTEPQPRSGKSTPSRRQDPAPPHQTPSKRPPQRAGSVPNIASASASATKTGSAVKVNPKPRAFVAPTPSQIKGPRRSEVPSPDVPKMMKPKRLMSACSTESLHQKPSAPAAEMVQTPTVRSRSVSVQARRSSALPTPVNRRVSGIPMMTPKSVRPGLTGDRPELVASARKMSQESPSQMKQTQQPSASGPELVSGEVSSGQATLQPCSLVFSLEDDPEELANPAQNPSEHASVSTTKHPSGHTSDDQNIAEHGTDQQVTPEHNADHKDTPELNADHKDTPEHGTKDQSTQEHSMEKGLCPDLEQCQSPQENVSQTPENKEVLLIDAPAPVLRPEDRLLIDLSNTPDLIKTVPLKPSGGQLIDLSSPLITWSPTDKKENVMDSAPLINLSF